MVGNQAISITPVVSIYSNDPLYIMAETWHNVPKRMSVWMHTLKHVCTAATVWSLIWILLVP